jgi:hypothetical protein
LVAQSFQEELVPAESAGEAAAITPESENTQPAESETASEHVTEEKAG